MTLIRKRYTNGCCKLMLLTVYLFLFTAQLNYRFYSIANFYVYGNASVNKITAGAPFAPHGKTDNDYKATHQDRSHLSLDKRFQGRYPIQATAAVSLPALLTYAEFRRKYAVCKQAVQSFDRIVTSLRGPPACA
ncbi:MAG TPA: hypothetical protein VNS58_29770 [Puia sp.]|nr:hypothetical protein [Puia sp.]